MVLKLVGFLMVGLALLGAFLPVLPTTPFLLVAATCFAKSSPKWHQWLLSHKLFGPFLTNWQQHRCITLKTKLFAVTCICVFGGYSLYLLVERPVVQLVTGGLLLVGFVTVARIKICRHE